MSSSYYCCCPKKYEKDCKRKCDTLDYKLICEQDLGRSGLTIDSHGVYFLAEDISFNPRNNGSAAITIAANDVTLDLRQFTLKQSSFNNKLSNIGVLLVPDVRRIVIKNGNIDNFSAMSIWVSTPSEGDTTENLIFDDLVLTNSGRPRNSKSPSALRDGFAGANFWVGGLGLGGQPNRLIEEVTIRRVISNNHRSEEPDNFPTGLPSGQPQQAGVGAAGILGAYVERMVLEDCTVGDIRQSLRTARGFTFASVKDVEGRRLKSSGVTTGEGGTGINFGPAQRLRLVECVSTDLRATQKGAVANTRGAAGLGAPTSSDVVFERCYVSNIRNLRAGLVWGIHAARSDNVSIKDCVSEDILGDNDQETEFQTRVHGFYVSAGTLAPSFGDPEQTFTGRTIFEDCQAINARNLRGPAWGFHIEPLFGLPPAAQLSPSDILIKNCAALHTSSENTAGIQNQSAGFGVRSSNNVNIYNSDAKAGVNASGINYYENAQPGTVRVSRADENDFFGFRDETGAVLFTKNEAYLNGNNYDIASPVAKGTVSSFPDAENSWINLAITSA